MTITRSLERLRESSEFSHQLHCYDYRNQVLARGLLQCQQGHHHGIVKKKWLKYSQHSTVRVLTYIIHKGTMVQPADQDPAMLEAVDILGDLIINTNKSLWSKTL